MMNDISDLRKITAFDTYVGAKLIKLDKTPQAILFFASQCDRLSDFCYWWFLGTIWVSYTGGSELELWKRMFRSERPNRTQCLMKPSELKVWDRLPQTLIAYRAHRPGETDWISYTLSLEKALAFAKQRNGVVKTYAIERSDTLALFTRRGEDELIVLDKQKVRLLPEYTVTGNPSPQELNALRHVVAAATIAVSRGEL